MFLLIEIVENDLIKNRYCNGNKISVNGFLYNINFGTHKIKTRLDK